MTKDDVSLKEYIPSSDDFHFRKFPFYWLVRVTNAYTMRIEKSLKKLQINTTDWRLMLILREQGAMSVSDIATHAVVKMPTITKSTYKLQKSGFVKVKTSETDGRVSIVMLTGKGFDAVAETIKSTEKVFKHVYDGISAADIEKLNQMLQTLFDNLDAQ